MPEFPLVPDVPTPGTMDPLRSGRPLTRRELREREAAAHPMSAPAASSAAAPAAAAAAPAPAAAPSAPAPARPAFDDLFGGLAPRPQAQTPQASAPRAAQAPPALAQGHSQGVQASPVRPQTEAPASAPRVAPSVPQAAEPISRRARRAMEPGVPVNETTVFESIPLEPSAPSARRRAAADASVPPVPVPSVTTSGPTEITGLDIFGVQFDDGVPAGEAAATTTGRQRHPASRQPEASGRASRRAAGLAGSGATAPHQGRRRSGSETGARAEQGATARSAAPRPQRRRARGLASIVAMGFVAMLALSTTIPALSLLSEDDVQALALTQYGTDSIAGQRMLINGDVVAQSVDRESYESQTIEEYAEAAGIRPEATFTNNPSGTIQWPFAVGVHIGDRFGYRDCAGCSSDHHGQDFNPGYGAEIQAIADGVVSESTDEGGSLGVVTMIDHQIDGETVTSVYAHMQYDTRRFEVGDVVEVGDVLGNTGNTGMSTGPHLHFEIRIGGIDGEWVDPLEWLYANTN